MYNYFRILYHLAWMNRRAYWSRERLKRYQDRKVKEIVRYAYGHVPFYHSKFKQLGLKPEDIRSVEDLAKLPITRKEELQKNADKLISDEFNVNKLMVERTSGSTGMPLSVYLTKREDEFRKAKLLRANISCGQKPRDRWIVITEPRIHSNMAKFQRMLGIYAPFSISVLTETSTQISMIERFEPDVLEGYSSSLYLLAKQMERNGIETIRPRLLIGGAELIDTPSREYVEKVFGAPFYDQYSSVEFDALAWQCVEKDGYHIDADTVVMQLVDENGEEVEPGEEGEVVCTSLFNYAMPLIRYSLDDIGVLSEGMECSCGRIFPLMKVVAGRKDSIIVLPDGRSLSPLVIGDGMMFFKYFGQIDRYRVIQKKINFFKILVKKKKGVNDRIFEVEFAAHFRRLLKVDESEVTVDIEFVDEISKDKSGKLRKIVSELKA